MAYIWPEHSQPQKPFPDLLCVGFGGFCVLCIKYCRSDAASHETAKSSLAIRTYSSQPCSWFQALGNVLASFCLEALGFLFAAIAFVCISGLKCRLIISLTFYFDFLFKGEMYWCKPTHTHTILVSLGHLLKGIRHIAVVELYII